MKKLYVLSLAVVVMACGQIKPKKEIPPCRYKAQWNASRCGVSMYQNPDTLTVFAQPGEVIKVNTREDNNYVLESQDSCFILRRGAVFSKNEDSKPSKCGFKIESDGKISAPGMLVDDGAIVYPAIPKPILPPMPRPGAE